MRIIAGGHGLAYIDMYHRVYVILCIFSAPDSREHDYGASFVRQFLGVPICRLRGSKHVSV